MMKENKMDGMMKLNEEQLEEAAGGFGPNVQTKGFIEREREVNSIKPCITKDEKHKFVKTGVHREVDALPFGLFGWTNGQDEYLCTICGYKMFSKKDMTK